MKLNLKSVPRAKLLGSLASVLLLDSMLLSRPLMCPDGNMHFLALLTVWRVNKMQMGLGEGVEEHYFKVYDFV